MKLFAEKSGKTNMGHVLVAGAVVVLAVAVLIVGMGGVPSLPTVDGIDVLTGEPTPTKEGAGTLCENDQTNAVTITTKPTDKYVGETERATLEIIREWDKNDGKWKIVAEECDLNTYSNADPAKKYQYAAFANSAGTMTKTNASTCVIGGTRTTGVAVYGQLQELATDCSSNINWTPEVCQGKGPSTLFIRNEDGEINSDLNGFRALIKNTDYTATLVMKEQSDFCYSNPWSPKPAIVCEDFNTTAYAKVAVVNGTKVDIPNVSAWDTLGTYESCYTLPFTSLEHGAQVLVALDIDVSAAVEGGTVGCPQSDINLGFFDAQLNYNNDTGTFEYVYSDEDNGIVGLGAGFGPGYDNTSILFQVVNRTDASECFVGTCNAEVSCNNKS